MKGEEMIYTIPLGKAYDYSRKKRAMRAVRIIREFAERHSKCRTVIISQKVNEKIWSRSIQKPPRKIKVKLKKISDEKAKVMLPDEKEEVKKEEKPKEKKDGEEKVEKKKEEERKKTREKKEDEGKNSKD